MTSWLLPLMTKSAEVGSIRNSWEKRKSLLMGVQILSYKSCLLLERATKMKLALLFLPECVLIHLNKRLSILFHFSCFDWL